MFRIIQTFQLLGMSLHQCVVIASGNMSSYDNESWREMCLVTIAVCMMMLEFMIEEDGVCG